MRTEWEIKRGLSELVLKVECRRCVSKCDLDILYTPSAELLVDCTCPKCGEGVSRIILTGR